jgi:hypothetical protein
MTCNIILPLPDLEINIFSLFNRELLKQMAQELEIIRAMELCEVFKEI